MNLEPGSRLEALAFKEWDRQQLLWMQLAKMIVMAIPGAPPGSAPEVAMEISGKKTAVLREFIYTLFPELGDAEGDKEADMAAFLKSLRDKPIELRVTEDPRGNMDIALKR